MAAKELFIEAAVSVAKRLRRRYRDWAHFNRENPLEELLFIICSIQTNEERYRSTFAALRREFPTFQTLAAAPVRGIEKVLSPGGLAFQKAKAIRRLIRAIMQQLGKPTLAPLRAMDDGARESFLVSLPGVGKKTARCVMMYSFGSEVFPVDVHCWRICRRLGWAQPTRPDESCSPKDMDRLQERIPPRLRRSLHVNMVSLGREICTPENPKCSICPLRKHCTIPTGKD